MIFFQRWKDLIVFLDLWNDSLDFCTRKMELKSNENLVILWKGMASGAISSGLPELASKYASLHIHQDNVKSDLFFHACNTDTYLRKSFVQYSVGRLDYGL